MPKHVRDAGHAACIIRMHFQIYFKYFIWHKFSWKKFYYMDMVLAKIHKIPLTHWGRVTHICVGNLTIIGPDNGLSPGRRQAIIWTNAGILLIRTLGTNFSEILGEINSFSFSKIHLKMSSAKWRLFGLGLNELNCWHALEINRFSFKLRISR